MTSQDGRSYNPRLTHLKIKIKTLRVEAQYIRAEEHKKILLFRKRPHEEKQNPYKWDSGLHQSAYATAMSIHQDYAALKDHRRGSLREASRSNHLAYGFLRGMPYAQMEMKCGEKNPPPLGLAKAIAKRFTAGGDQSTFEARWKVWEDAASEHLLALSMRRVA